MNISAPFIRRPVATTLLTIGIVLAGLIGFRLMPVSPLPQVDFPTISVSASLPGADPETMSTSVAAPLERRLGAIAEHIQIAFTTVDLLRKEGSRLHSRKLRAFDEPPFR